jgi:hypothetical protein
MIDLIKPEPKSVFRSEKKRMGDAGDLVAAEIRNLQGLISSPKFSQIVIGDDGYPARMVVPDPQAFTLHKAWLCKQRDRAQALATLRKVFSKGLRPFAI